MSLETKCRSHFVWMCVEGLVNSLSLSLSFCVFVPCALSLLCHKIEIKHNIGQLSDFWFDFTSWKNESQTQTACERKRTNPSLPSLSFRPELFVYFCSFTLNNFVAELWGWAVTFSNSLKLWRNCLELIWLITRGNYYFRLSYSFK